MLAPRSALIISRKFSIAPAAPAESGSAFHLAREAVIRDDLVMLLLCDRTVAADIAEHKRPKHKNHDERQNDAGCPVLFIHSYLRASPRLCCGGNGGECASVVSEEHERSETHGSVGWHDGRGQKLAWPEARDQAWRGFSRCRHRDRERGGLLDQRDFRPVWRTRFPRRRAQGDRAALGHAAARPGNRRRRVRG